MDLSNAFNCIDRAAVLQAVRRAAPELAPWVDFCYSADTQLLLGTERLDSARGVQQGDPLGPALFALTIHPKILKVKARVAELLPNEIDLATFYLQ